MRLFLSIGDLSAANYVYEILKEGFSHLDLVGFTDRRLEELGVRSLAKITDLSVVGIAEVLPRLLNIKKIYKRALKELEKCDVLIACDAPGFNLRLIKDARKIGVRKIIYFISPQVWAWKPKRAKTIAEYADHLIVILPFEINLYREFVERNFKVHFVGHPLVDLVKPSLEEKEFRKILGLEKDFINMMPGSRWGEIRKHTAILKDLVRALKDEGFEFVIPTFFQFKSFLSKEFSGLPVKIVDSEDMENPSYNAMFFSRISIIASGTSSLEAALSQNPHVVFYKVSPLTYMIAKLLVKIQYVSLPNIILDKYIVPEIINGNRRILIEEVRKLLKNEDLQREQVESFREIREKLGEEGSIPRLRNLLKELLS